MTLRAVPVFLIAVLALSLSAIPEANAKGKKHGGREGAPKRIAITSNDGGGPPEAPVRAQLRKVLKKSKVKVVGYKKGGAPADDQQWVALGQKLKVDGFAQLSFEAGHGRRSVEITVRTASDGSTLGSATFTAKGPPAKLGTAVARNFWKKLGAKIGQTARAKASDSTGMPPRDLAEEPAAPEKAAAEPEPPVAVVRADAQTASAKDESGAPVAAAPDEKPSQTAAERPATTSSAPPSSPREERTGGPAPGEPALTAVVQLRYLHRSFVYTPSSASPSATVTTPTIGAEVAWFPLSSFGLTVGGEGENWAKELGRYPTSSSDIHASLVFRLALSFGELSVRAGAFRHFFAIADDGTRTRLGFSVPDVVYTGARGGGALALPLGQDLSLTVAADYRLVTDLNGGGYPLTSPAYFPRASPGPAFDGAVMLAYRVSPMFEAQAGADIRRYVMALKGQAGDRIDASGGTDLYLAGWIGVGGAFGGR